MGTKAHITKMRITVYLNDRLGERLRKYTEDNLGGRHGSLSIVVEKAIEEYLDKRQPGRHSE